LGVAEPNLDRLREVESQIEAGFRVHARGQRRVQSVRLADDLADIYDELSESQLPIKNETADIGTFFSNADRNLQRTRKIVEVIEDSLDIGLGHSKLTRIAMTGANLNSAVAVVTAAHNLLLTANELDDAHRIAESISDIAKQQFLEFYRSLGILIAEAILFTTPINYRVAWKGTRYLNNRILYKFRHSGLTGTGDKLLKGLHRLILSESHYAIKGILPAALRSPDEFVSYLSSMTSQTLNIIWDFTDINVNQVRTKIEEIILEYQAFAADKYGISDINADIDAIVENVLTEIPGDIDLLNTDSINPGYGL